MPNYNDYTREQLLEEIKHLTRHKKFGLVWEDKPEDVVDDCRTKFPVLQEDTSRAILRAGASPVLAHIIIEGDNYHSLSVLNVTHKGKIDVIYIDPPYNTGNKDFKYNDNYVDREDSFRHSKWLSFMEKRLRLAKNLLNESGVIFISIDDNEQAHLKLLCDEVFGEGNFVTTIHCQMSTTQGMKVKAAQGGNIVKNAEYVLCYSTGNKNIAKNPLYDLRPEYDNHYSKFLKEDGTIIDLKNVYDYRYPKDLSNKKALSLPEAYKKSDEFAKFVRVNLSQIVRIHLAEIETTDKETGLDISKKLEKGKGKEVKLKDKVYTLTLDSNGNVRQLLRLIDSWGKTDGYNPKDGLRKIRGDWWEGFYLDMGNVAKEGGVNFKNGKKPVRLIKQLVRLSTNETAIVLDFFAGSGTTGHAVLELNKEDGGHRQFILCTNNENKICEEVTYPRIKTVITGKRMDGSKYSDGIPANVRYFKTEFLQNAGIDNVSDDARINLTCNAGEMLALKENIFAQTELNEWWQIFEENGRMLAIYFKESKAKMNELLAKIGDKRCILYIFGYGKGEFADEFGTDKIEVKDIPEPILEIYKHINGDK